MEISHLDHLVLRVSNLDATLDFYQRVLGMRRQSFSDGHVALHFCRQAYAQKINLHQAGEEFEPRAQRPTPGSADLCLVTETSLAEAMQQLRDCGVDIIAGQASRTGASGPMESFYFRGPGLELSRRRRHISLYQ